MQMICGARCHGIVYRCVLTETVDSPLVQLWIKFDDSSFRDRYILDSSIMSFDEEHSARDVNTPPLFPEL
jgi:hypothetical protein